MRNMTIAALLVGLATLGACSGDEEKDDTAVEDTAADTADTSETGDTATDPEDTASDTGSDTSAQ